MKKLSRIGAVTLQAVHIPALLLLLVSAYSGLMPPDRGPTLVTYLGLAFPIVLLLNVGLLIVRLVRRDRAYTIAVIIVLLLSRRAIEYYTPLHFFRPDAPAEHTLKVLTYNVRCFGYKDHTPEKPNEILRYIAASGADIVCLQEYLEGDAENILSAGKIARALSMYPYHYYRPLVYYRHYSTGLAIFSKYPILSSRKVRYDSTFNGSTVHVIDVRGRRVTVVNNHLESFKLTQEDRSRYTDFIRNANSSTLGRVQDVFETKVSQAFRIRAEQARIVAEEIAELPAGGSLIVCGDFNDTPLSYAYRTVCGSLSDAYAESGVGPGISYNRSIFRFRIDHLLHSSDMRAYSATVDNRVRLSDHYPLWCVLEMGEETKD